MMSRICLRFELPIPLSFRSYRRYRWYRWTGYFGGSVYQCSVGGHETKPYIPDGVLICPSVRAEKNSLPTVNYLYHRYRRYYLLYQRILNIQRWRIHFSIGTNGQPRFTDGKLPLPSVPSVPMDKVSKGYLMLLQ